jgi:hypothetical protein
MNLTTRAHCISHPPCEWTGTTDRSAETHTKETGHATIVETIANGGSGVRRGMIQGTSEGPRIAPETPLSTKSTARRTHVDGSKHTPSPAGGAR